MVNVRHLAVFRAVAKTGAVSAAARVLHISQPAVTKTLHLLEEELGMQLFQRIKGRLLITPEAQALLPQVERLFGQVDAVHQFTQEIRSGHVGSLTVASVATLSSTIVAMTISRFSEGHPKVLFDLRAQSTRQVIESVRNNQADIGVIDVSEGGADMDVTELCRADLACVMRHDHPLTLLQQITPADLAHETIITFAEDTQMGWAVRDALRKKKSSSVILFTVNQTFSAYALAQSGSGVALVDPFPMLTGVFPELRVRPFRPSIQSRPHALISSSRPVSLIAREFVKDLQRVADEFVARSQVLMRTDRVNAVGRAE
jgi:DNA-binding transcriptional LysR family regulator